MTGNMNRKPWLAGLMNVICMGLGQFYCGQAKRGLALYCLLWLTLLMGLGLVLIPVPKLNAALLGLGLLAALSIWFFGIYDAVSLARRRQEQDPLPFYNKWYFYLAYVILLGFVISTLVEGSVKSYLVRSYKIPSGAMHPALLAGDHILVNKFIFRFEPLKRGDVIVFKFPRDERRKFIKRIIGLSGEVIELRRQKVYINDKPLDDPNAYHLDPVAGNEPLSPRDDFGPVQVPEGHVFVMGDNRENSLDSRFWGFLKLEKIQGKVSSIYWSWDHGAGSIRWNRVGMVVE